MKITINQIIIFWIVLLTIFTVVFNTSTLDNTKNIVSLLNKELNQVKINNETLINASKFYKKELQKYKHKTELLQAQNDSILLSFKRQNAADWLELQNIKNKQKDINKMLIYLRKLNKKYE